MILVSGTKRSGTSMWMQILAAAGLPILGEAFPRGWDRTIRDANPDGFFESILREGIYYRTNPHPATGDYFLPQDVAGYAVKVFVPGVIRTERAYIDRLVANVRERREYEGSLLRLFTLERGSAAGPPVPPFPPAYEWWMENFALVRDISLRRYPARLQTYDAVLAAPARVVEETLGWLGLELGAGDTAAAVAAAVAAVKPEHRTQDRRVGARAPGEMTSISENDPKNGQESDINNNNNSNIHPEHGDTTADTPQGITTLDPALDRVFDDLYAAVAAGRGFSKTLLRALNETNRRLLPQLRDLQRQALVSRGHQSRGSGAKPPLAEPIAGLPRRP